MKAFKHSVTVIICAVVCGFLAHIPAFAESSEDESYVPVQTIPQDLKLVDVSTVKEIPKSDQIILANGKRYKLDGIRVPASFNTAAVTYLEKNLLNKKVGLYANPTNTAGTEDSFGNRVAHAMTEDAVWVQGDLVAKGIAWVSGAHYNRDLQIPLLALEARARKGRIGLWRDPANDIKKPEKINTFVHSFQIIEGKLISSHIESGEYYFGFDTKINKGIRIYLNGKNIKPFLNEVEKRYGFASHRYVDKHMRVRGWVDVVEGQPQIEVTYPEQWQEIEAPKLEEKSVLPDTPPVQ